MSRGHGTVQRRILAALADKTDWTSLHELAAPASQYDPMIESTRRAVHSLEREGLVETCKRQQTRPAWLGEDGFWRFAQRDGCKERTLHVGPLLLMVRLTP